MKTTRFLHLRLLALALTGALLSSCLNPFGFWDFIAPPGVTLRLEASTARTVLPAPVEPSELIYTLTFERAGYTTVTISDLALGSTVGANLAEGQWQITIEGSLPAALIPSFRWQGPQEIVLGLNTIMATLSPLQISEGQVEITVSWPEGQIDGAEIFLRDNLTSGSPVAVDAGKITLNSSGLVYADTLTSGRHYLGIQLKRNGFEVSGIYETLRIYDGLTSAKTFSLSSAQISQPPAAPTGLIVAPFNSMDNSFEVSWIDNSLNESGFRVMRRKVADPPEGWTVLTETSYSTTTFKDYGGLPFGFSFEGGAEYEYQVTAFNDFGTSAPISGSRRTTPMTSSTTFSLQNGGWDSTLSQSLSWAPVTGADSIDVYLVASPTMPNYNPNDLEASFGTPAVTGLAGSATSTVLNASALDPMTKYWYAIIARNAAGFTNLAASFGGSVSFETRGLEWYVANGGNNSAQGSSAQPLATIAAALGRAPGSGGRIILLPGLYEENVILNKSVILEGSGWESTTLVAPALGDPVTLLVQAASTIKSLKVQAEGSGSRAALRVEANTVVEDSQLHGGTTAATEAQAVVAASGHLELVRSSVVPAGPGSGVSFAYGLRTVSGFSGSLTLGGSNPSDGNVFVYGEAVSLLRPVYLADTLSGGAALFENNTFETFVTGGTSTQAHLTSMGYSGALTLRANTFSGGQGPLGAELLAVDLDGGGSVLVEGNEFTLNNETDVAQKALRLQGGFTVLPQIRRNRVTLGTPAGSTSSLWNVGFDLRAAARVFNNLLVLSANAGTSATPAELVSVTGDGVLVAHNTVVNQSLLNATLLKLSPSISLLGNVVRSNLLLGNASSPLATTGLLRSGPNPNNLNNNLIFYTSDGSSSQMTTLNSNPWAQGNSAADPQLDGNLKPQLPSPLLVTEGADPLGQTVDAILADLEGVPRTYPASVGAFEYNTPTGLAAAWKLKTSQEMLDSGPGTHHLSGQGAYQFSLAYSRETLRFVDGTGQVNTPASTGTALAVPYDNRQTIVFWIYGQPGTNAGRIFSRAPDLTSSNPLVALQSSGTNNLQIFINGNQESQVILGTSLNNGVWNLVAVSFDAAMNQFGFSVNGGPLSLYTPSSALTSLLNQTGWYSWGKGMQPSGDNAAANLYFSDLRVYSRVLSNEELSGLYAGAMP